jgi:hypothetical protein
VEAGYFFVPLGAVPDSTLWLLPKFTNVTLNEVKDLSYRWKNEILPPAFGRDQNDIMG